MRQEAKPCKKCESSTGECLCPGCRTRKHYSYYYYAKGVGHSHLCVDCAKKKEKHNRRLRAAKNKRKPRAQCLRNHTKNYIEAIEFFERHNIPAEEAVAYYQLGQKLGG